MHHYIETKKKKRLQLKKLSIAFRPNSILLNAIPILITKNPGFKKKNPQKRTRIQCPKKYKNKK